MAKKKATRRGGKGFTLPVALLAGLAPALGQEISAYKSGGFGGVLQWTSLLTTGYDPADNQWKPGVAMQYFYGPLAVGYVAHKLASRLGINRALGQAGVPIFRL